MSPLPIARGTSRGVDVYSIGRLRRSAIFARHAAWRPELVWSLWANSTAGVLLSRAFRAAHVVSLLGGEAARLEAIGYGGARTRPGRLRLQLILRSADVVTVGSTWLAERVAEVVPEVQPVRTPIGVRAEDIPQKTRATWSKGQLSLCAVADASPVKGPRELFAALAWLRARGVDATLTIFTLATEENRRELRSLAQDVAPYVHLEPPLPPRELYARLADFDVFLAASAHEAQGLAMTEAALAEVPVVATAVGVAPELAALGAAHLAKAEASALGAAVLEAAQHATGARDRLAAEFGLAACTDRWLRALERAGQ